MIPDIHFPFLNENFNKLLCLKLIVDSVYGQLFMGTKMTVMLRHNVYIIFMIWKEQEKEDVTYWGICIRPNLVIILLWGPYTYSVYDPVSL